MLLKNNAKRLITINGAYGEGQRAEFYRIKPGDNPAVEVPNRLCENAFVQALIKDGSLRVDCIDDASEEVEPSEYDDMKKPDLIALCESFEIEVTSRDTVRTLIDKLEAHDAE